MNAKKLFKLIRNDKLDVIEMLSDTEKGSYILRKNLP